MALHTGGIGSYLDIFACVSSSSHFSAMQEILHARLNHVGLRLLPSLVPRQRQRQVQFFHLTFFSSYPIYKEEPLFLSREGKFPCNMTEGTGETCFQIILYFETLS